LTHLAEKLEGPVMTGVMNRAFKLKLKLKHGGGAGVRTVFRLIVVQSDVLRQA